MHRLFKEITDGIKKAAGLDLPITGGRTAEVNVRLARLMGREIVLESPAQEYARILKEAKVESRTR
jgi:hypothetical protein